MLQQTQVLRVIAKYREFIERYPRVSNLAKASPADILRIWKEWGITVGLYILKGGANDC